MSPLARTMAALLFVSGSAVPALAEPAFAVRTGYRCSQCHVNRTGGGMRTSFGSIYTQTTLPARLLPLPEGKNLLPANPDALFAVGANFRSQYLFVNREEDTENTSSFEVPEANLYGDFRLLRNRMNLYVDAQVAPGGASAREVFGLFSVGNPWRGYVKVGKFLPAYGWRLPDDAAFIRQFSGFTYSAPDIGVEFGAEPGQWSLHLSATNGSGGGSDVDRMKRMTLSTARRFKRRGRLGLSATHNDTEDARVTGAGLFGGANFGRLSLLAEGDWFEIDDLATKTERLIAFIEGDILISRGFNLKIAHDWIDPDRDQATDQRTRTSVGLEYIPIPFLQLRGFVRFRDGPPQVIGARDTQVDLEVHIFF